MRNSLYWDDFEKRVHSTVDAMLNGKAVEVSRVSIFITDKCNFKCGYCNHLQGDRSMSLHQFESILDRYGENPIYHVTGGEPSMVNWLYDFIRRNGNKYRFHLNTNAYIKPPSDKLRRIKISLDSNNKEYWNKLVGINAFDKVLCNIKESAKNSTTSVTCTLNKENYKQAPEIAEFILNQVPDLYAVFFSVYKGSNERFEIQSEDVDIFFDNVLPKLRDVLGDTESRHLLDETIDEKIRILKGVRFPNNGKGMCYLSLSERVFSPSLEEHRCSHLYRDFIRTNDSMKNSKCLYGCNRRLVIFNEQVEKLLREEAIK